MDADVVVIGAGAAGLAAARCLAGQALRVMVLEARDRAGGRVASHVFGQPAVRAELGAEFIHGPAAETMALLREAGTTAIETAGERWRCAENGDLRPDDFDFRSVAGIFDEALELASDESVDRFLMRFEDATMRERTAAARTFVEGFDAADPTIASAQAIADEWRSGVDASSARPAGGYHPMFEHLVDACAAAGVVTSLSTVVDRITWRRGAVAVRAKTASGECRTSRARAAVVTLPAGVLRHSGDESEVVFEPSLPAAKRDALASVEMGPVVKVVLRFRTRFWERICDGLYRDGGFFRCDGQPFAGYWTQFPVRNGLVVAWAGGPKAAALSGISNADLIERALTGFGAMFGEEALARREFEGGTMHDWIRDPFSRGAYSYIAVGGTSARAVLAEPVDDTLFFAGEATSDDGQGGTVNGALETGERAAREVAAALGTKAP